MGKEEQCYWCGAPASSREHVPPRVLFPEAKDLNPGDPVDFRKNLATVPACKRHNEDTSRDDQIAAFSLTMLVQNNEHATRQFGTKVMRSFQKDRILLARVIQRLTPITFPGGRETAAVKIDVEAVHRFVEKIARALYFIHHGLQWDGTVQVMSNELVMDDLMPHPLSHKSAQKVANFSRLPPYGLHPDIFLYNFALLRNGELIFRMRFYGGANFFALLSWSPPPLTR